MANNDKAVDISERDFEKTINLKDKQAVVVDFYGSWCMPCLILAPVIEELASKLREIKFARVDVDENKRLSKKFNITSIPCLIVFKDGKEVERITGALPEEVLEEKLKKHLK